MMPLGLSVRAADRWPVALLTSVLVLCGVSAASAQTNWRFIPQAALPMGTAPTGLLITDLTGDGLADLAVSNPDSDTITVRVAAADRSFGAPIVFGVGDMPEPIAAGDLDGDGLVDLVIGLRDTMPPVATGEPAKYGLSVLLGTGDADLFRRVPDQLLHSSVIAPTTLVRQVALADFTGDGLLDVLIGTEAILSPTSTSRPQQILFYRGLGVPISDFRFSPINATLVGGVAGTVLGESPSISVVDPNNDGVAVAISGSGNQLRFRSLSEPAPPSFDYPEQALTGLVTADFNQDGLFDIASSHHTVGVGPATGGINILYAPGLTALRRLEVLAEGNYIALKSADMDGNGAPDIVALRPSGIVAILQRSPFIGFESAGVYLGTEATSFSIGDLDGDGRPDLAATTASGVLVLLQRAPISPALVDDLETQVSDLQQQIVLKDAAIENLTTQVEDLTGDNLDLQDLVDDLTDDLSAANQTIADRNATIEQLETQVSNLTTERNHLATENATLQGQLNTANGSIQALTSERNNLASAKATLQGQLNSANDSIAALTTERNNLASANATLRGLLDNANSAIATLTTERNELATAKSALQAQLNAANDTITSQQTTIGTLQSQLTSLTTQRNDLVAANSALQGQLNTANGTIASQEAAIGNLQTQLAAANQTIANLTSQLANASADLAAQILSLQQALQAALTDPGFAIPGSTPQAQVQNLVTAINGLNPGQKQALYKNLGGKKP
jgi:predicted  nucleic acid-binding Zn-ribbon protein